MTVIFESKVATVDDIDDRLDTITRADWAILECWEERVAGLSYLKEQALAAFDAGRPNSEGLTDRTFIEAYYEAMMEQVRRDLYRHRLTMEELEEFYIDLEATMRH